MSKKNSNSLKKQDFRTYLDAAEQGDADSQYNVGRCYFEGTGVDQDNDEAYKWFEKAAEQNHVHAEYMIGECFLNGVSSEAFKWFLKAAEHGDAEAQYKVGRCYFEGSGVGENEEEAFKWLLKSAEQGHAAAQYMTGRCYLEGIGVLEDKAEAFKWYSKASEQGNGPAQFKLSGRYFMGEGVSANYAAAFKWWKKSVRQSLKDNKSEIISMMFGFVLLASLGFSVAKFFGMLMNNYSGAVAELKEKAAVVYGIGMCEYAEIKDSAELWRLYLEEFPDGKCAETARRQLAMLIVPDANETSAKDRDEDESACENARKHKTIYAWQSYLKDFPNGKCADKAEAFLAKTDEKECETIREDDEQYVWEEYIKTFPHGKCADKADKIICEETRKQNTRAAWESYLKLFPDGKCAEEGKAVRKNFKKTGNLEWSDLLQSYTSWKEADNYCKNLEEDGHSDWRVPNIDELRTLVQNHPGTVVGGKCRISEKHNKLNDEFYIGSEECYGMEGYNFSKLCDTVWLLSSSKFSDYEEDDDEALTWGIDFGNGALMILADPDFLPIDSGGESFVRCVRQDDHDACETAKKYNKPYYWMFYLENFPNGECAAKAKVVWEKEDKKACKTARKENTRAAWENYLKKFAKGQCADEGNAVRNKLKQIGGLEWADISDDEMSSEDAASYCKNLEEDGYKDWRLPTMDELRVLVQNHPGTVAGGKCKYRYPWGMTGICQGMEGDDFSKLGDKEKLLFTLGFTDHGNEYVESIDFSNGGFSSGYKFYVRCVRQDDSAACEAARKEETDNAWKYYLSLFPKGVCAEEARAGAKEDAVCERARKENTRAAWEKYLEKFPNGKCAEEGKTVRGGYIKVGNVEWSDIIENNADKALSCEDLEADGHKDWRDPNIDELRLLVQNHPGLVAGGKCGISELEDNLDELEDVESCGGIEGENFSKLGDRVCLASISRSSDSEFSICFDDGGIVLTDSSSSHSMKRCVRQNDGDACETAKKYNKFYYWKHYLENFPDGKCAAEAKVFWEKEDRKKCKKAREVGYWKYKYLLWKIYLKEFPNGKCAAEAAAFFEKDDKNICRKAVWKKEYGYWKDYLQEYPKGYCAEEAKRNVKKMQTTGWLQWSEMSEEGKNWNDAVNYCRNLKELGYTDWRLPNIDELRVLVQNCPKTERGGECRVSAKNGCLAVECQKPEGSCSCEENEEIKYSRLRNNYSYWLWSSSTLSDSGNSAWRIDFSNAEVGDSYKVGENYVRCVR